MAYENVEHIMRMWIRGYKGAGFGSWFIKKFTFGEYSHVSMVFQIGHVYEEIEAIQGRGVIRHEPYAYDEKDFDELTVPLTEEQVLTAHMTACGMLEARYDWKGIWSFIVRRNKHNPEKWFCSELVAYCLYKASHPLSRRAPYQENPSTVCQSLRLLEHKVHTGEGNA